MAGWSSTAFEIAGIILFPNERSLYVVVRVYMRSTSKNRFRTTLFSMCTSPIHTGFREKERQGCTRISEAVKTARRFGKFSTSTRQLLLSKSLYWYLKVR